MNNQKPRRRWFRRILLLCVGTIALFWLFSGGSFAQASSSVSNKDPEGSPSYKCQYDSMFTCTPYSVITGLADNATQGHTWGSDKNKDDTGYIQNPIVAGAYFMFYTFPEVTIDNNIVHLVWNAVLTIVDIFIVLTFVMEGVTVIFGSSFFKKSESIEAIPRIILAIIAAHLSFSICIFFVTLNNSLTFTTFTWAETTMGKPQMSDLTKSTCTKNWGMSWRVWKIGDCEESESAQDDLTQQNGQLDFDKAFVSPKDAMKQMNHMIEFMVQVVAIILLGQVLIRLFLIDFFVVMAPIGIGCFALPGKIGAPMTRLWLHGMISIVMIQFIQTMGLIIEIYSIGPLTTYIHQQIGDSAFQNQTDLANVMRIACLWFIVRVPSLFKTSSLQMLVSAGQMLGQIANTTMNMQLSRVITQYQMDMARMQMELAMGSAAMSFR